MSGKRKTPEEEVYDLRATIREAHETIQAMKETMREMRAEREQSEAERVELHTLVRHSFEHLMQQHIDASLAEYYRQMETATMDAKNAIMHRFDTLCDVILHRLPSSAIDPQSEIEALVKDAAEKGMFR